jgi:arginase
VDIQLLAVPYDSGQRGARMGAGPEALLRAGLEQSLRERGHSVHTKLAELAEDSWQAEIQTAFELMRMVSVAVREAVAAGKLPIILAGNCNTAVGTIAGLGAQSTGVAWFDAHADFNTADTTRSGFLDGTAVATITGRCWRQLALSVPGFEPVSDNRVCLIGTRDIDTLEEGLLGASNIEVVRPGNLKVDLPRAVQSIGEHADEIYVHLDLDVLDSQIVAANHFAVGGGLSVEDVEYALSAIARDFHIGGMTLSAYDPSVDAGGAAARAAIRLICAAAALAGEG